MKKRISFLCLMALLLNLFLCPVSAAGEEPLGIGIRLDKTEYRPGERAEAVVFFESGNSAGKVFTGLQIDIDQIDEASLKPLEYVSLIKDTEPLVNTASYVPENQRVRMLYARMDEGTQQVKDQDVLKVVFELNAALPEGPVTLPVAMKMTFADGTNQTVRSNLTIICVAGGETDLVTVDISWGKMEFSYTEELWDPMSHSYLGAGWTDHGTGTVTVTCNGKPVTAELRYDSLLPSVSGSFQEGSVAVSGPQSFSCGQSRTFSLILAGRPERAMEHEKIGTVNVTLGGK